MTKDEVKARIREWIESNTDANIQPIRELQIECTDSDFIAALNEILIEYETAIISSAKSATKLTP